MSLLMRTRAMTYRRIPLLLALCAPIVGSCFLQPVDNKADESTLLPPVDINTLPPELTTPGIEITGDNDTTADPCVKTEHDSMEIRQAFCSKCHEAPNGLGQPPFDFIMDDAKLSDPSHMSSTGLPYVAPG